MRLFVVFLLFSLNGAFAQNSLKSPEQFLPTEYSVEFTPYHLIYDYFQYIGTQSDQVVFETFGQTEEGRPLGMSIVSSPSNIKNIEAIRENNLKRIGFLGGAVNESYDKVIIWLNFGSHGNEPGSMEGSMDFLFQLVNKNPTWLDDVVILINPCLNPDGQIRYVNWNRSVSNKVLMPNINSREHQEPWPSGRGNHYYFDLNRDWAWATQKETKANLGLYHQWMPQVMVDMHEQGVNGGCFIVPAIEPIHDYITKEQLDFFYKIGKHNAKAFDKQYWRYFSEETYDLFYPSYGDTYSIFNGAIGMTYEGAGHKETGKGLIMETGDTLLLSGRIQRCNTVLFASLSYVAKNKKGFLDTYSKYFLKNSRASSSVYSGFVIKNENNDYLLNKLIELLNIHHIRYYSVSHKVEASGFNYDTQDVANFKIIPGDIIIPTRQGMGRLINALFEPKPNLGSSKTYDVTAWSLPYAYGLSAYALMGKMPKLVEFNNKQKKSGGEGSGQYAWLIDWGNMNSAAFLAQTLQKGINVRYVTKEIVLGERKIQRGGLVILKADNRRFLGDLRKQINKIANRHHVVAYGVDTGWSKEGPELGSNQVKLIKPPRVAIFYGDGVDASNYGEIWHYFDQELRYPIEAFQPKIDSRIWKNDILILASGDYYMLTKKEKRYLGSWVESGGRLCLFESACNIFENMEGLGLKTIIQHEKESVLTETYEKKNNKRYEVPGGIVQVKLDTTHPLCYGYGELYYSMKTIPVSYALMGNGDNVGYTPKEPITLGYFGENFLNGLPENVIIGQRNIKEGQIVYFVDNPLFRGVWESGKLMVANMLFFR